MGWKDLGYAALGGAAFGPLGAGAGYLWGDDAVGAVKDSDWLWGEDKVKQSDPTMQSGGFVRDTSRQGISGVQGRNAPQMSSAQINPAQQAQFRSRQMALANRLTGVASGQQMGAGEMAAQRGANRAIANQQAMARMGRGAAAPTMARQAAMNTADIGVSAVGQRQQAALADQSAANQALAGVLGQGRQQDIGMATHQADLNQAGSLANMEAKLKTMGMNDAAILGYLSQMTGVDQAELSARLEQDRLKVAQRNPGMAGDLLAAAGPIVTQLAASDRRVKQDIKPGDKTVKDFLAELEPYDYEYKDKKHGTGRRTSVMAQDLEKSKLGKQFVSETTEGTKYVDYGKGLGTILASVAHLNKELEKLKGK